MFIIFAFIIENTKCLITKSVTKLFLDFLTIFTTFISNLLCQMFQQNHVPREKKSTNPRCMRIMTSYSHMTSPSMFQHDCDVIDVASGLSLKPTAAARLTWTKGKLKLPEFLLLASRYLAGIGCCETLLKY